MKKNWRFLVYSLILSIIIFVVYFPITRTFYQQDEWYGFGMYLANGFKSVFLSTTYLSKNLGSIFLDTNGIINIILGEGRIFTKFISFLFYKYYPLNIVPVAIFSIIFHIANSILVFLIAKKIFNKTLPAFLGSIFFAVNSVSQSAITWPAASVNALPSTLLILLAIIFFTNYIELKKNKWLIFSFLSIYISLFFRETGIFLFLLLPLYSLFYQKYSIIGFLKKYWYYLFTVGLIVIFRIYEFKSVPNEEALFLTGTSKYFLDAIFFRSILYPLTSFSLSIVPPDIFLNFARNITNIYYPFIPEAQFILVAQTVVLDLLSILLSMTIGFVLMFLLVKTDAKLKKQIIFWIVFLIASFLPYIIISKSYSYLESRYYYVGSISWSIIFAWLINFVNEKIRFKPFYYLLLLFYLFFIFIHVRTINSDIKQLVDESQNRIKIISQLKSFKPNLDSNKNIFYIYGDTDYYIIENKIPFQSGMGYNLMSLYYSSGKVPNELLNQSFLFEIGSQGYKEVGGIGFGYFSNIKLMEEEAKKYNIPNKNIYKFYYNSKTATLEKI